MKKTLQKKNIVTIQASSQSHKSVDMIKRVNKILKVIMRKMKISDENFFDILRKITIIINDRHIEHLNYIFNEINYDIESRNKTIVNTIKMLRYFEKIILSISEDMLSLI